MILKGVRWVLDNLLAYADRLWESNWVPINERVGYSNTRIDRGRPTYMRMEWDEYRALVELELHEDNGVMLPRVVLKIPSERKGEG